MRHIVARKGATGAFCVPNRAKNDLTGLLFPKKPESDAAGGGSLLMARCVEAEKAWGSRKSMRKRRGARKRKGVRKRKGARRLKSPPKRSWAAFQNSDAIGRSPYEAFRRAWSWNSIGVSGLSALSSAAAASAILVAHAKRPDAVRRRAVSEEGAVFGRMKRLGRVLYSAASSRRQERSAARLRPMRANSMRNRANT